MTQAFETDRDTVRSASVSVTSLTATSAGDVTFTATGHTFTAGLEVTVTGAGDPYNGTWVIKSTTSTTFTVSILSSVVNPSSQPGLNLTGAYAYAPAPAYLRYASTDATLTAIGTYVTLTAEPWDYNTIRISWSAQSEIELKAQKDIAAGLTPRVCIVRSGFGTPSTPLDGTQILNEKFTDAIPAINRSVRIGTTETQPSNQDNPFNRPNAGLLALYDRNLTSGRWYYYSIFFYLKGSSTGDPTWQLASSVSALTPKNYEHGKKLYELLPPYYQYKDQEFVPGRGRKGDLERLIKVIGFDMDYTRTLAEGIEHLYNIDYVNDDLLKYLGEGNFGVPREGGLGDIRYRSLLAAISRLYDERGSSRGLEEMTFAATKYRCKVLEGINMMNLTDDAEFASGTGAWANPAAVSSYSTFINSGAGSFIGGSTLGGSSSTFNTSLLLESVKLKTIPSTDSSASVVTRRQMLRVTTSPTNQNNRVVVACGLGEGSILDRYRVSYSNSFTPRSHGIRCTPGTIYSFAGYSTRINGSAKGVGGIGIMWFNEPTSGVFATSDFISKTEAVFNEPDTVGAQTSSSLVMPRYSLNSTAPLSTGGQPYVYAVPYFVFSNGSTRYISACIFYKQLNSVQQQTAAPTPVPTLTLGVTAETLGSTYYLGEN